MITNTKQTLLRFEETATQYLKELDNFSIEQLVCKPSEEEWSLGQMHLHLIQSALYMQLRNIEACRMQEPHSGDASKAKTEQGNAIFALGSFPPIRISVPASNEYTPEQPATKEQLTEGIQLVIQRMNEIEPTLHAIPSNQTIPHPRFGELNAIEWFTLVEMHYRHHLHQKARLIDWYNSK